MDLDLDHPASSSEPSDSSERPANAYMIQTEIMKA